MNTVQAAMRYQRLGWHVFPLGPDKVPLGKCLDCRADPHHGSDCTCPRRGLCHGFYAATLDADLARHWFTEHPEWQLGVRTGAPSGIAVVDVDLRDDGTWGLADLEAKVGAPLPGTLMQHTSGGGLHLLYRHPGVKVTSGAGKLALKVDVKADLAYVVAAPSVSRRTGRTYAWQGGWDVLDDPDALAPWPGHLLDPVLSPPQEPTATVRRLRPPNITSAARHLEGVLRTVHNAAGGQRNQLVHWGACRIGAMASRGEVDVDAAAMALLEVGLAIGLPRSELVGSGSGGTIWSGIRGSSS